jgi:hypothetical protein
MAVLTEQQLNDMIEILADVASTLKYTPYIYKEVDLEGNLPLHRHFVKHKDGTIDDRSVFFFVPVKYYDSTTTAEIGFLYPGEGYQVTSNTKYFKIKQELNGSYSELESQFFVPNRLYMFRKISATELAVINYRSTESFTVETMEANNIAVNDDVTINVNSVAKSLRTALEDITELKAEVAALKQQIKIGTAPAEEALQNEPAQTIYIKVEDL